MPIEFHFGSLLNALVYAIFGVFILVLSFFVLDKLMFGKTHVPHDSVDDAAHELLTHSADHS